MAAPRKAQSRALPEILEDADYEDYCFDAQQAAEKVIKAVFIQNRLTVKRIHDLRQLLTILAGAGVRVPKYLMAADRLTRYSVETRYPGFSPPVRKLEYQRAVRIARRVLEWAERQIK